MKVESEDTGMIVRSAEVFAIFASHVIANFCSWISFSESFNKELEVSVMKRLIAWEMCVVICKCYETIMFMKLGFVHTAHSPLTRTLQAAANTLAARQGDVLNDVGIILCENDTTICFACGKVSRVSAEPSGYGVITGHVRWTGTFLESPASTLGS